MPRLTRYQWLVLFAAWLGWGFDIFDGLLFNLVAPACVPDLLHLAPGSPEARAATLKWTGILTSVLLLGWAAGGILFGFVADRIGRSRTLLLTMLLYALGTAACAFVPNIETLMLCRLVASLGIGGEWAAGAAMVAEAVPEKARVEAGALLYTSAPVGLFLASFVNHQVMGVHYQADPAAGWRVVFLFGLVPALVAVGLRAFVKEPPAWHAARAAGPASPRLGELFSPGLARATFSGFAMALVALLGWWSCNAFLPVVSAQLGQGLAAARGLTGAAATALTEGLKVQALTWFNLGGLIGTLLTIPLAKALGRRAMFRVYFAASAVAIWLAFGLAWPPETRVYWYLPVGLSVFGVFGSFTYYLPELFPTRLRATGAGFCYNTGRILTAAGPFLVGFTAQKHPESVLTVLAWVAVVPLVGLVLLPWVVETRGRALPA